VYKSVAFDIFGLLVGEIADEAQKYFEEHRAEEEKDRDARFLRDFTDRVNAVQGVQDQDLPDDLPLGTGSKDKQKRGKRTKRAPFSVSPGNTKILRGTSITFRVYGYTGTSGKFQCQIDNGQCGDVQQLDDLTFEYAGDKAGSDTLVFSDAKDPKKEVRRVVEVVTRRGLAINPLEITIPQGGQQRFSVANHHLLKPEHNVRWSMDDQKGLRLLRRCRRNSQTCTVYASSSCPLGTYVLVGQVPDTRMKATATFTVIEGDDREVPLRLEDRWYRLRAGDLQETLVHLSQDFRLDTTPGSKRFLTEIKIKLDHPVIHQLERLPPSRSEQAHDQYRNLVILDAIIAAHLAQEGADGMSFVQRMSELQRIVIPAFSAK
ncbi:hypothetical protein KKC44_05620, partial [Patescibacteria group bacterium]|nr:hypothetical protein [Patescibacteria group bacterium]